MAGGGGIPCLPPLAMPDNRPVSEQLLTIPSPGKFVKKALFPNS